MSNVIPIRGEGKLSSGGPPKPPRRLRRKKSNTLQLRHHEDGEDFTTLDVINGLRGVCQALDSAAVTDGHPDSDSVCNLAMAANVLSDILANRVES